MFMFGLEGRNERFGTDRAVKTGVFEEGASYAEVWGF